MSIKSRIRSIAPDWLLSSYHLFLAWLGALLYSFPSKRILLIGVTGTKGKSSVVEMVNAILEEAGHTTAVANSIRFKIAGDSRPNLSRMSMLGRFFLQRFLDTAIQKGCTAAIIEITSEGSRQSRHRFLDLDALVFTNLAPEHIESHGSYEAYADAKLAIGKQLARSHKRPRIMVANADDAQAPRYLGLPVDSPLPFSLSAAAPYEANERGGYFTFDGQRIPVHIAGEFSLRNALAAATLTRALGVKTPVIAAALEKLTVIPGRAERIEAGQDFDVVVDYAHTPESLQALYDAYKNRRKVCVLGSTGGGRDTWKRPVMGEIADRNCDEVILTNEDPYDEDPEMIVRQLAKGCTRPPKIIMDRRAAIAYALARAHSGDAVLITGKGTDPTIVGPRGTKQPWSDAAVARDELKTLAARGI
jgi:UDP-N-acetylmuramoyl-L-alanyl-D-glutamate--2,6-diaminopimelate ligase